MQVHERAEGRDHALCRPAKRGSAKIGVNRLEQLRDAVPLGAGPRLGEHRLRSIERDHDVAVAAQLDGDAARPGTQLDHRIASSLAEHQVEADVVVDV